AFFAGLGMIVAAMYLHYMVGRIVWGPLTLPHGHDEHHGEHGGHAPASHTHAAEAPALPRDLSAREIAVLAPLAVLCVVLGIYPTPILRTLEPPVNQTVELVQAAAAGARSAPGGLARTDVNIPTAPTAQTAEVNR